MRRMWVGVVLLAALLATGVLTAYLTAQAHSPVTRELGKAAQAALTEDWEQAGKCAARAQAIWQGNWDLTAAVADHSPMEEIDGLLAELQIYLHKRESVHFSATCARLCKLAQDMADAHAISWWNLF